MCLCLFEVACWFFFSIFSTVAVSPCSLPIYWMTAFFHLPKYLLLSFLTIIILLSALSLYSVLTETSPNNAQPWASCSIHHCSISIFAQYNCAHYLKISHPSFTRFLPALYSSWVPVRPAKQASCVTQKPSFRHSAPLLPPTYPNSYHNNNNIMAANPPARNSVVSHNTATGKVEITLTDEAPLSQNGAATDSGQSPTCAESAVAVTPESISGETLCHWCLLKALTQSILQ